MGSDYKNNFLMKRPYIIAEIGVNHNGNFDLAKKTIKAAAKSGADAVKFQMFHAEEFMSNTSEIYKYKTAFYIVWYLFRICMYSMVNLR